MRLFIAINLPSRERAKIHRQVLKLSEEALPIRWVAEENYHVTLKFLGEVHPDRVADVGEALDRAASGTAPMEVELGGFGAFPTLRRPRVVWLGMEPSPALRCLKQDVEWTLSDQGFERETRAFHPHVTLGRAGEDGGAGVFRGFDELVADLRYRSSFKVRRVDLMRSHPSHSGPRYSILRSSSLKSG